ncbi:MAG: ArsR family transcriptional regulator [Candidatus Odinarchaeota archaeon]
MAALSGLLAELSDPVKLTILNLLGESPRNLVELENKTAFPVPVLSNHLDWLEKQGFISKELTTENYHLEVISQTMLNLLIPIDFVLKRVDFFREHRLLDLPTWIVRNVDALKESEFVSGKKKIRIKVQEILERTSDELYIIADQPFPFGEAEIKTCSFILSPEKILMAQEARKKCSILNVRFLNSIIFALFLSNANGSILFFPDSKQQPDYNNAFFITEEVGLQFVTAVWNYFWEMSGQLSYYP